MQKVSDTGRGLCSLLLGWNGTHTHTHPPAPHPPPQCLTPNLLCVPGSCSRPTTSLVTRTLHGLQGQKIKPTIAVTNSCMDTKNKTWKSKDVCHVLKGVLWVSSTCKRQVMLVVFETRVSCAQGWLQTCYTAKYGLELLLVRRHSSWGDVDPR